jgi:PKD repeat protein
LDCVTFYDQVQAAFTATPTSGTAPLTVNFSNQSLGDYDTCTWDFGDGETSTQCNGVQHTYEEARSYTVELTVNGEGGSDTEPKWNYIAVTEGNSIFLPLILRHGASGPINAPPHPPSNPSPPDNATSQSVDVDLSWTGGDPDGDSVTYAVYLEPDDTTPDVLLSDNQVATSYDPGTLNTDTHYYWQIVATDSHGATTTGPIWEFSTETSPPPNNLLTPFDANEQDVVGPSNWATRYGKTPEIIVSSNGVELDVLAQDYNPDTTWHAVLLHIEPNSTGYEITQSLTDLPMLDRVMGLATDDAGNRYYATGVDESDVVDPTYPPPDTYRSNIVRVIKLDPMGNVLFNIDLDTARHAYDSNAEMIINPMTFASSRLAVGGNEIALVHSINTNPDSNDVRHQKALSTRLNATSGAITRVSSVWVSHSFDQRLCYDGEGIIEHHLGDAYPRYIVFARNHTSYPLFHIKGALGENNTHTRLGNIALIENDAMYDYIALFATENSAATGNTINGPRNLAIVRVNGNDNSIDPNLPDTLTVTSSGEQYTNRLRWLTQYTSGSNLHAERPKLIGIGGDQYIVLWEEWLNTGDYNDTFNGVYGMLIDDHGNTLQEATLITNEHHLHRGDDAFLLDNRAAWMTGSATEQKLYIHLVDASLNYEFVPLD